MNNNKPAIRFKGFSDAWEQRKLNEGIIEHKEITTENNQYPPLTSSRKGLFLQTEYFAGNQIASEDNTGYNVVPRGYFTYRHMSDDEIFHFNINEIVENGIVSTLYPVFTTNENLDSKYLQYQLNYGKEFSKFAVLQKQGGSRTYMYLSKLKQLHLTMPKNVVEQKKIARFLVQLDNLITLHQRKYEKLQNVKKSMLEKMFPKNGSEFPEIRFKGFTDAWEQREFGEIFSFLQSNSLARAELSNKSGNVSNVHYGDILVKYGEILNVKKDALTYLTNDLLARKYHNSFLQNGDVIIADAAEDETVGKCTEITGIEDELVLSGLHTIPCRPLKKFSAFYLGYFMNSKAYHDQLFSLMQGTKVLSISKTAILNTAIFYPTSEEEQRQIGQYFTKLDNLITLHQRELEKLQNIKKSMLEKMFV